MEQAMKSEGNSLEAQHKPPLPPPRKCPRCESSNTKFCYYNNYSHEQPRYLCKTCRRYWTHGGSLRNVPVGGGSRRNRRSKSVLSEVASSSTQPFSATSQTHQGIVQTIPTRNIQVPNEYDEKYGANVALWNVVPLNQSLIPPPIMPLSTTTTWTQRFINGGFGGAPSTSTAGSYSFWNATTNCNIIGNAPQVDSSSNPNPWLSATQNGLNR